MKPLIIFVEALPIDVDGFFALSEEEQQKQLNPIDSRIIAIGIKADKGDCEIFIGKNEADILRSFWSAFRSYKGTHKVVGFNARNFDVPFIVTRSFICDVAVESFSVKDVIDIREQVNAFRYGQTRGKLLEFAKIVGVNAPEIDSSEITKAFLANSTEPVKKTIFLYLDVISKMYDRMLHTNVDKITRW